MLGFAGSGVISPGARADLVFVNKEALDDLNLIDDVRAVVRAGKLLDDSPMTSARRAASTSVSVVGGMARTLAWAVTRPG